MDTIGLDLHKRESSWAFSPMTGRSRSSDALAFELMPVFEVLAPIHDQSDGAVPIDHGAPLGFT